MSVLIEVSGLYFELYFQVQLFSSRHEKRIFFYQKFMMTKNCTILLIHRKEK